MLFDEFFKKKKINLQTFEQGEPALFSEFKIHYEQMGEKSFDHTKKYWFNKLRLRFPAPIEIKAEKVVIENQLAEQTITESLIESSTPAPNVGFKPKFRAGVTKPTETAPEPKEATEPVTPSPSVGFKPRFKAGVTKPAEPAPEQPKEDTEPASPSPSIGFKPRFKAGITKPAEATPEQKVEPKADDPLAPEQPAENKGAKPAYKPRFNMNNIKPKSEE